MTAMSSKMECFNCLGKIQKKRCVIVGRKKGGELRFCSKPCMKVALRAETEEDLRFIHILANNDKYFDGYHQKFIMKVSQAIKDHVSERMLTLYFKKLLECLENEFGRLHVCVEDNVLKEGEYINFGDAVMWFKSQYKVFAHIWSND